MPEKKIFSFSYHEYTSLDQLSNPVREAIEKAKSATERSYANYSSFLVGAALILESGEIIESSNQENASYPNGLCAESLAFFYASSRYPDQEISAIVITARKRLEDMFRVVSPCGSCRQVMLEYESKQEKDIPVYLYGEEGKVFMVSSVRDLLPFCFTKDDLE